MLSNCIFLSFQLRAKIYLLYILSLIIKKLSKQIHKGLVSIYLYLKLNAAFLLILFLFLYLK